MIYLFFFGLPIVCLFSILASIRAAGDDTTIGELLIYSFVSMAPVVNFIALLVVVVEFLTHTGFTDKVVIKGKRG